MPTHSAKGVTWTLTDLFSSHDDPRIDATLKDCKHRAEAFAQRFRGPLNSAQGPRPVELLQALMEIEAIYEQLSLVGTYAGLLYAADSLKTEYQDLEQRVELRATEIRNLLLFFELDWMEMDESTANRLITHPDLKNYSHYLTSLRRYRPYKLSEAEERIVNEKDTTGKNAFSRLFSELTSSLSFAVEQEGKTEQLTLSEALSLLHNPDRELRRHAANSVYSELAKHRDTLSFVYDNLVQDHLTMDRLRRYPDPMAQRHLSNEINPDAVNTMMEVTERNYAIGQEYFRLKARLLKLPRLEIFDQYAPVGEALPAFSFSQAREVILEAFGAFSPSFHTLADEFFIKHWIDAETRKGKRGGAFCASPSPNLHPYILCNYTDNLKDVMTVAHELGHGMHGCLSRKQTYLNYDTPLTTAETASVFGEMLVFDHLLTRHSDPKVQLALIAGKIEDSCATVFRQNVLTRFEQSVFDKRLSGRLPPQTLGDLWLEANGKYYGDAVNMTDGYQWGWSYIPHFIHSRFYCYSYVFGELLVLSLYRMYREQGENFVPKYLALLEAGGSDSPEVLLNALGVNINDAGFWQKGFDEIGGLIRRLQGLIDNG